MAVMHSTSGKQHYQYSIESSFSAAADLAKIISEDCAEGRAHLPEFSDTMRLCLAEALNNIVEHAYEGGSGHPIHVDVTIDDVRCDVRLIDKGRAMPNGCVPDVEPDLEFDTDDLDSLPEGGFGLFLLQEELDAIAYNRYEDHNVLTLTKFLS